MRFASFSRRLAAYLIDVLPITLVVFGVYYFAFDFDVKWNRYFERGPRDAVARADFYRGRNQIRDLSLAIYLVYSSLADGSALQGTLGKWLMGIQVVDASGVPLSYVQAAKRNIGKLFSFAVCGLGCLWVIWSPTKQAWHDSIAGCMVIRHET